MNFLSWQEDTKREAEIRAANSSKNNTLYHRHVNMTEGKKKSETPLLVKQVAL